MPILECNAIASKGSTFTTKSKSQTNPECICYVSLIGLTKLHLDRPILHLTVLLLETIVKRDCRIYFSTNYIHFLGNDILVTLQKML